MIIFTTAFVFWSKCSDGRPVLGSVGMVWGCVGLFASDLVSLNFEVERNRRFCVLVGERVIDKDT